MSSIPQPLGQNTLIKAFEFRVKDYAMIIALIVIAGIFTGLTRGTFLTPQNISNILIQTSFIAVLAVGMVLVIVAGHIDLSVGSVAGLCGAILAVAQNKWEWGIVASVILALVVGLIIGIWQGFWVAYLKLPAFIVTLAGLSIFRGMIILITNSETIGPLSDGFSKISDGYIPQLFLNGTIGKGPGLVPFHDLTLIIGLISIVLFAVIYLRGRQKRIKFGFPVYNQKVSTLVVAGMSLAIMIPFGFVMLYRGIPWAIVIAVAIVGIFHFISTKTVFGRQVYAIGGNKEAARLSGINIKARNMLIFVCMGVLSAIAGIMFTARMNSATTSAGTGFELDAIAAAIIGGTSTLGGSGTILGAVLGALIMGVLNNGMSLCNLPTSWQMIVKGAILLLAVLFDIMSRNRAK